VKLARADRLLPIVFPDPYAPALGFAPGRRNSRAAARATPASSKARLVHERHSRTACATPIRRGLAPNPSSLSQAIKLGKRTFEAAGGPRAYFGDPRAASAEEGSRLIDALGTILEEAVLAEI